MIYDEIAIAFINICNRISKDLHILVEMNMEAYVYDEYGDKITVLNEKSIMDCSKDIGEILCQKKK